MFCQSFAFQDATNVEISCYMIKDCAVKALDVLVGF